MTPLLVFVMGLHIVLAVAAQSIMKAIANTLPKAKSMVLMFIIASVVALTAALWTRQSWVSLVVAVAILGAGFVNSFGTFCQWQAYRYSLSKSSLFLPVGQVVAAGLAAVLLNEAFLYTNETFFVAVVLMFLAGTLLSRREKRSEAHEDAGGWASWALGMVFIFGGAIFLQKLFSSSVSTTVFLTLWYAGGAAGSLMLIRLERDRRPLNIRKDGWKAVVAGLGIMSTLATLYWAFQLAPAGVVLPVKSFGGSALGVAAGWIIFSERQRLHWMTAIGFAVGLAGVLLLSFSRT